jgi:nucleotide-binding universal stress UspA family protein
MMVALKLEPSDEAVLDYLDYLSAKVPIRSVYFEHVLPPIDLYNPNATDSDKIFSHYELNMEAIESMREQLWAHPISERVEHFGFEVQKGNPLEELLKNADEVLTDLLVIGQRAGTNSHGILARNLARKVATNALIIPENTKAKLAKILVPIDFSEYSIRTLKMALSIKEAIGDDIEVQALHVYQMPNLSIYKIQKSFEQLKRIVEADRMEAFEHFMKTHFEGYEDRVKLQLLEQRGPGIAKFIMDYADENDMDMIIMGAKGHSRVERLLLGSVTEKLCSTNDHIPVFVIK